MSKRHVDAGREFAQGEAGGSKAKMKGVKGENLWGGGGVFLRGIFNGWSQKIRGDS